MMKALRPALLNRYVVLIFFAVGFFAIRVPYYAMPLQGEDGIFADMFLAGPQGPAYALFARIDGKPVYGVPEHPAPMYETIKIAGKIFKLFVGDWRSLSEYRLTFLLRLAFSLFQLAIFLGVIAIILSRERKGRITASTLVPAFLVMVAGLSHFAVRSSISLQVDGTSGIFVTGIMSIAVLLYREHRISFWAFVPMMFLSALWTGLGKNEWSIVLTIAVGVCFLYCILLRMLKVEAPFKEYCIVLAVIVLGNAAGNFASYLYDPVNYLGGFNVIGRIVKATGYATTTGIKVHHLYLVIMLLALLALALPGRVRKGELWPVFLGVYGFGLFSSFLLSKWAGDVRYFAPSIVPLLSAVVIAVPVGRRGWRNAMAAVIVSIAAASSVFLIRQIQDYRSFETRYAAMHSIILRNKDADCIPLLESAVAYRAGIDFIGSSMGLEGAQSLAAKVGKRVCAQ